MNKGQFKEIIFRCEDILRYILFFIGFIILFAIPWLYGVFKILFILFRK